MWVPQAPHVQDGTLTPSEVQGKAGFKLGVLNAYKSI